MSPQGFQFGRLCLDAFPADDVGRFVGSREQDHHKTPVMLLFLTSVQIFCQWSLSPISSLRPPDGSEYRAKCKEGLETEIFDANLQERLDCKVLFVGIDFRDRRLGLQELLTSRWR